MATGIPDSEIVGILKRMTQEERVMALLKVLERIYWQRLEGKGKRSRSEREKQLSRYAAAKKASARKAGLI